MAKHFFFITTELVSLGLAANLAAAEVATQRVVVHVVDYAQVSKGLLDSAERLASKVYENLGVTVTWREGHRPIGLDDGDRHVELAILSHAMTEEKCRNDQIAAIAFGAAVHEAQRAVVFFDRAKGYAQSSGSMLVVVLALVMAHELGHLLLPSGTGHTKEGIMRPHWAGHIQWLPRFERSQAETIRRLLSPPLEAANAR